jgi:asparaginyl-tRNA synthetase
MEPEIAFAGIEEDMENAEAMIKYAIKYTVERCKSEYEFLNKFVSKGISERLETIVNSNFKKMKYEEIVSVLKDAISNGVEFEESNIEYGMDFGSEHERYIAETHVGGPVFATHYPKDIKSFYMRQTEGDERTVDSFDLLIPGVGELIGGSARENNLEILEKRMKEMNVPKEGLE